MALLQEDLIKASKGESRKFQSLGLESAHKLGLSTAFLCHSHNDNKLASGLQKILHDNGWNIYIDWQDTSMPDKPDLITAKKIKHKIESTNWFLFLATDNSKTSRWCPWEIGYADAVKETDNILIISTMDKDGTEYGNEYLKLYKRIDSLTSGDLAIYKPDSRFLYESLIKDIK